MPATRSNFRLVEDPLGADAVNAHAPEDLADLLRLFNESCGREPVPDYSEITLRQAFRERAP